MNWLSRVGLEIKKQYWESKRSFVALTLSFVVTVGVFALAKNTTIFKYLISADTRGGALWIYCAWIFCTGASLDVSKSVCADITCGTLASFAKTPHGLMHLTDTRFCSSCVYTFLTVALISIALILTGVRFPEFSSKDWVTLPLVLAQTYALTLLIVAIGLRQKNELSANLAALIISVTVVVLPIEKLVGTFSNVFLIAGPLAKLRTPWQPTDLLLLTVATMVWVVLGRLYFSRVVKQLKIEGTLLFR